MALSPKIDFDNLYEIEHISPDLKLSSFHTELDTGDVVPLVVKISNQTHALLPNVYNLAFGPLNPKGKIDDKAELAHHNYSKVFSTILFTAFAYLKTNPGHYLGIDGSDNARAYFYYRALQRNFAFLNRHFNMYGIKYFVRITRFGKTQYDNPFDFEDIIPYPFKIDKDARISQDHMYNYFIFNMKQKS
ncbi:MAG: hypothetical protein P0Y53_20800 [Candidatus Pseudobacter hemicellulosilyticus]|uniref:Uncharacterized protein n=1 Tax=Candidatus Pseudobacter hemicellulosilyticus TaxID=3121375 RepID=A0AAJ5WV19_9BACT|nr:MAG: hypothetical protein P0Y53_20800 [Pseudobacter sp.]